MTCLRSIYERALRFTSSILPLLAHHCGILHWKALKGHSEAPGRTSQPDQRRPTAMLPQPLARRAGTGLQTPETGGRKRTHRDFSER
jgi:hypothetical protein